MQFLASICILAKYMECSSPTHISADRTLPRRTVDQIRMDEKRLYIEQLLAEAAKTRIRIEQLRDRINSKSMH